MERKPAHVRGPCRRWRSGGDAPGRRRAGRSRSGQRSKPGHRSTSSRRGGPGPRRRCGQRLLEALATSGTGRFLAAAARPRSSPGRTAAASERFTTIERELLEPLEGGEPAAARRGTHGVGGWRCRRRTAANRPPCRRRRRRRGSASRRTLPAVDVGSGWTGRIVRPPAAGSRRPASGLGRVRGDQPVDDRTSPSGSSCRRSTSRCRPGDDHHLGRRGGAAAGGGRTETVVDTARRRATTPAMQRQRAGRAATDAATAVRRRARRLDLGPRCEGAWAGEQTEGGRGVGSTVGAGSQPWSSSAMGSLHERPFGCRQPNDERVFPSTRFRTDVVGALVDAPSRSKRCVHLATRRPPTCGKPYRPPAGDPRLHQRSMRSPRLPAVGPRDRRGGRPHLALHRARPPRHPPATGFLPRPHQAPGHRGPLRPGLGGQPSSGGRSATSPWSATWPPAPTCSPQENVEELLPAPGRPHRRRRPVHAAGAGRLDDRRRHPRRRLRGGPPAARRAETGDIVVAGIPGEEATVKTFTAAGGKVVLVPANARLAAHGASPPTRSRSLRQGRAPS